MAEKLYARYLTILNDLILKLLSNIRNAVEPIIDKVKKNILMLLKYITSYKVAPLDSIGTTLYPTKK